ncbi:MAG: acyl carrier protein [Desulfovibrionaceae bacterium]
MDKQAILAAVQDIVRQSLGRNDIELTPETSARDVRGWDSLANIGIVMAVEARFNIRFGLGELDAMKNVGDIVAGVAGRRQG